MVSAGTCCGVGTPRSSRTKDTPGRWLHNKFKFQGASAKQPPSPAATLPSSLETALLLTESRLQPCRAEVVAAELVLPGKA